MAVYRLLADVVLVLHFTYALFVVVALPAILAGVYFRWSWVRNFWFRTIHLGMISIVAVQSLLGIACPLTTLENALRGRAGAGAYDDPFVIHWVRALLFVDLPSWLLTLIYGLFAALVLAVLVLAPPRWLSPRSGAN